MATGVPNVSNNDAFAARNFAIEVDGTMIAQFTELSGLTSEMDVTELKENGPDGKLIIKKIPGAHKTPTLTLKRAKNVSMELYKWHKAALDGKVFFFQAEDGIRDLTVTGVQTCALPI